MKPKLQVYAALFAWLLGASLAVTDWIGIGIAIARTSEPIVYPEGTSAEEAWRSPPKIGPEEAASVLADLLLADPYAVDEDRPLDREIEALKYLKGPDVEKEEPNAPEEGVDVNYVTSVTFDERHQLTEDQRTFDLFLTTNILSRLGLNPDDDVCLVPKDEVMIERHINWHIPSWNNVHIFGVIPFMARVYLPPYESAVVYGVFPIGLSASWRSAWSCLFLSEPDSRKELAACGVRKDWKVQGGCEPNNPPCAGCANPCTELELWVDNYNQTPIPAKSSGTHNLAAANGEEEWQTHHQRPPAAYSVTGFEHGDSGIDFLPTPTYHWPSTSTTSFSLDQDMILSKGQHNFTMVTGWDANIILQTTESSAIEKNSFDTLYHYVGRWRGNPHNVGYVETWKWINRWHGILCEEAD